MLNRLRHKTPEAQHKIVHLHADLDILFKRCQKKSRWSDEEEKIGVTGIKRRLQHQLKILYQLHDFDIQ
jgi:hypothetical protein